MIVKGTRDKKTDRFPVDHCNDGRVDEYCRGLWGRDCSGKLSVGYFSVRN